MTRDEHLSTITNINITKQTPKPKTRCNKTNSLSGTATVENEAVHRSLLAARIANDQSKNGKRAGEDAPPVNIGWNSHEAVVSFIHLLIFPRDAVLHALCSCERT